MTPEWLAEHQGQYRRTYGRVWHCDDDCACSRAEIVDEYQNKVVRNAVVPVMAWEGTFFTEGEGDAEAELRAERTRLLTEDPERAAQIDWWITEPNSR